MSDEHNNGQSKDAQPDADAQNPAHAATSDANVANENRAASSDALAEGQTAADEPDGPPAVLPPTVEEHEELKDKLLRTLAEMENLRRRNERDVEEARRYAVTGFARDLLEVRDNLRRGLEAVPEGASEANEYMRNLVTGIEMTERSLLSIFERNQIKTINPERGEKFDHRRHQAMFEVPTNELQAGSVAETMQPGYVIADRLLRPALVGVAKAAPGADNGPQGDNPQGFRSEATGQKIDTSA